VGHLLLLLGSRRELAVPCDSQGAGSVLHPCRPWLCVPASAKPLASSISPASTPERAPIQPPSEFVLATDPSRKMNYFFSVGLIFKRLAVIHPCRCTTRRARSAQMPRGHFYQSWAELIRLRNTTHLQAVASEVLQYCNSLNSIKNMQLLRPDTPSHATNPPCSAQAHPTALQETAEAFQNSPPISSTAKHPHDRNRSI